MRRPLQLTLCLTHDCTLRCRYCYAGRKYAHAMTQETAEQGIETGLAEAIRTKRGLDISFFGGEPLLEWELLQHCCDYTARRAAELKVQVRYGITTNGTLLTPERLAWMASRDFLIGLSIDGSSAMHDTNRCFADGRGSHELVATALQRMAAIPGLRSKVICVVNPANHRYLREGVLWLHEHYRGRIGLNFDYWSDWSDAQFNSLRQQWERLMWDVTESYRVQLPIRLECLERALASMNKDNREQCLHCRIGEREIAVSVDGNFFPCSRMVGVGDDPSCTFGNVRTGIDRARQNFIIVTRGNVTPECRVCKLRHRCLNTCGCTNYATSGHINRVSPFLCNLQQLIINSADRMVATLQGDITGSHFA